VLRPHSLCRLATVNTPANRQMRLALVVRGHSKKKLRKLNDVIFRIGSLLEKIKYYDTNSNRKLIG